MKEFPIPSDYVAAYRNQLQTVHKLQDAVMAADKHGSSPSPQLRQAQGLLSNALRSADAMVVQAIPQLAEKENHGLCDDGNRRLLISLQLDPPCVIAYESQAEYVADIESAQAVLKDDETMSVMHENTSPKDILKGGGGRD